MSHQTGSLSGIRDDSVTENLVFGLSFAATLPVAIVAKASGWRWKPWPPSATGYQNVFKEARLAAGMITTTVFSV
ncbi:MAG: light-harvesting protein [Pseudomonadota bacterium]